MDWAKKDAFFAAKVPKERKTITGIGDVMVHGLSVYEKEEWEKDAFRVDAKTGSVTLSDSDVKLLLITVHDKHGKKFFDEKDIGRIRATPSVNVVTLLRTAKKLSAIGPEDTADLVKNSPTPPEPANEDSSTG